MLEWRLGLDPDVQSSGAVPRGVWELPGDEMAGEELPRSPPPRWLEKLDPKAPEGDAGVSKNRCMNIIFGLAPYEICAINKLSNTGE